MKHYSNKEIREFISCPQFGDIKYGKWGSQKLEIRETLLHLITINEEMDKMLKDRLLRIEKAIEYIESNCNEFYANEPHYRGYQIINIEPLLDILKGGENEKSNNT